MSEPAGVSGSRRVARRAFLTGSAVAAGAGIAVAAGGDSADAATAVRLEGYADRTSTVAGETLTFYVNNGLAPGVTSTATLLVSRVEHPGDRLVLSMPVTVSGQTTPTDASSAGCRWSPTTAVQVPASWPTGFYTARFDDGTRHGVVPFVVRSSSPGSIGATLFQVPFTTAQAYNNWGGTSLYESNSVNRVRGRKVSFDRPFADEFNDFWQWIRPFVKFATRVGFPLEYATSVDLHANPSLLDAYQALVTVGHDEYWSRPMRGAVDRFVQGGGNAAVFSGNTCWWQVRFEPGATGAANRTMVCYKDFTADPVADVTLKTINWYEFGPLYGRRLGTYPENTTFGLSCYRGAQWTRHPVRPEVPYVVHRPTHWALGGTGLAAGSTFGGAFVGYETDSLDLTTFAGHPVPTALDGAPANLSVIALADATAWSLPQADGVTETGGTCVLASYNNNGTVVHSGTVDWVKGLTGPTSTIEIITRNVLNRLSQRKSAAQRALTELYGYRLADANGVPTSPERYRYATSPLLSQKGGNCRYDGVLCNVYLTRQSGTDPVFAYQSSSDPTRVVYSTSSRTPRRTRSLGVAFHAHAGPGAGRAAVYQWSSTDGTRVRYSRSATPSAGWRVDGIAFYAPTTPVIGY